MLGSIADEKNFDYSEGVAITSSFHPDEFTHIEPTRYGKGSNAMSLMQTVLTDGSTDKARWRVWLKEMWAQKRNLLRLYDLRHWSERTIIALVMQTHDNSITTYTKKTALGVRRMTSKQGHGEPNPTWIPVGNEVTRRIAEKIGAMRAIKGSLVIWTVIVTMAFLFVREPWHFWALGAAVAPRGHQVDTLDVALVQGGGPQRTRAADTDEREVFERHLAASEDIEGPVDLVLWPENVVNVEGSLAVNRELSLIPI